MSPLVERIESEIRRIDKNINELETFDDDSTVSLNGLVCLLKHAASANSEIFKQWLSEKSADINPTIMDRFVLWDTNAKHLDHMRDGVQIRIHIMREPGDDAKHNHQRSFVTMIIKGGYTYEYFILDRDERSEDIEIWERIPKSDTPFVHKETIRGKIRQVTYEDGKSDPVLENIFKEFKKGDPPIFVNSNWHHVISPLANEENPEDSTVITVVARRGKPTSHTTFLKGPNDGSFNPSKRDPTRDATEPEIEQMVDEIVDALTGGLSSRSDDNSNMILKIMKPKSGIVRLSEKYVQKCEDFDTIKEFMIENKFTYIPILDDNGTYKGMLHHSKKGIEMKTDVEKLDPQTSILNAILWTTLSQNFVVPIVKDGLFLGLLSLYDVMEQIKPISQEITWRLQTTQKNRREDYLTDCNALISALIKLREKADEFSYKPWKNQHKEINEVLVPLGNLLLNPEIPQIIIDYFHHSSPKDDFLEEIGQNSFALTEKMLESEDIESFLFEINQTCEISKLILHKPDNRIMAVSTNDCKKSIIEPIGSRCNMLEVLENVSKGSWPLFVENTEGDILILSIDELFSEGSVKVMSNYLQDLSDINIKSKLFEMIIKNEYSDDDFDNIPSLAKAILVSRVG